MTASPPIMQIHLLLNVLNRLAFTPGLGEREQAGIESLGDYLVAVHRLQSARQGSALETLRSTVETLLALNQWLREDTAPTVIVRCTDLEEDRLAAAMVPLAARVQAALMLLDGRPIREVAIELVAGVADASKTIRVVVEVVLASPSSGTAKAPAATAIVQGRQGVNWVGSDAPSGAGSVLAANFVISGV